eukprot:1850225-Lingulodinium_polyedra.AAC.1
MCWRLWPHQTLQALRLLQDAPCSIALVEKGHAAGAFTRRHHRQLGREQLELRSFLAEARPLLRQSVASQAPAALEDRWLQLLRSARCV